MAVLGLGRLGAAVATRLSERGFPVTGWNRSDRETFGLAAADLDAAVAEADVILMCLFDGAACDDVLGRLRPPAASTLVNLSTVAPEDALGLARRAAEAGLGYVHAPVVGSVPAARAGTLTVLTGGEATPSAAREVIDALGEVVDCGDIASAAAAKLLAGGALAAALAAVRDGRRWASRLGIEDRAWPVLERTPLGALVRGKRARLDRATTAEADFTVDALVKDLRLLADLVPEAAARHGELLSARDGGALAGDDDVAAWCLAPEPSPGDRQPYGLAVAPGVTAPPEVLAPLESYAKAHATGEAAHHRRAFLPTAHVEGLREGRFVSWTVDDYCALFTGAPAADEPERRRRIEQVAVAGAVATATMTLHHGPDRFTDAFVLMRVDGAWRIANKVYHRSPGEAPRR